MKTIKEKLTELLEILIIIAISIFLVLITAKLAMFLFPPRPINNILDVKYRNCIQNTLSEKVMECENYIKLKNNE